MKRALSIILLTGSCLMLIVSIVFCFYGIYGINRTSDELSNNASASGIDYWGIGWEYGIALFFLSTFGLILSMISTISLKKKVLRYISIVSTILFVLLIMVSICLFFA